MGPRRLCPVCLALVWLSACGAPAPAELEGPPASAVVEETPLRIRRELLLVPGARPEPNPRTGAATPEELNRVRVVRYRVDAEPPRPARAVVLLMPGLLGGAGSLDVLARALVRRSTAEGAMEAWAIDRRANLLEDHRGLDWAEVRRDPEIARRYYFEGEEIQGARFSGFRSAADASFASEWGLRVVVEDLRAVVTLLPLNERRRRVVLLGHSLGAAIAEEYAAWDFAGTPGFAELAALVLVEGSARVEGQAQPPLSVEAYEEGGGGPWGAVGLRALRERNPFFSFPLLGPETYPTSAIAAMRSAFQPEAIVEDPERAQLLRTLLSLRELPPMTNRAALGFGFGRQYNPVSIAAITAGVASGGPLVAYDSPLGSRLLRPADPRATYHWVEFDRTEPPGITDLAEFSRIWYLGPGLDFAEWYFPARLPQDVQAAATLVLQETDWPWQRYGLRASRGAEMDLPVLAMVSASLGPGDGGRFAALRALLAPVPLGPGRPLAGTSRQSEEAFRVIGYGQMTHLDPITGADVPGGVARAWYDALAAFVQQHTPPGGVVLPSP